MSKKVYDCLIIGGGPAGLGVATTLARQNHTALVFDSGVFRNAVSKHMHNVLGWDHRDPADFRKKGRQDLVDRYPCIQFRDVAVNEIRKSESGSFEAIDGAGEVFTGRKVCLATGVRDVMPDITGYAECWGRGMLSLSIFHCLFCHGYEERGKPSTGVLAMDMLSDPKIVLHIANMAVQLSGKTTLYTNGSASVAEALQAALKPTPKISIDSRKVTKLAMASKEGSDVTMTFADGTTVTEGFIVNAPNVELNGPFVQQLSLETNPSGEIKVTPPFNATSVPGVFAGGDNCTMMRAVAGAVTMGGWAGVGITAQIQAENLYAQ